MKNQKSGCNSHEEYSQLLPWFVNGTLGQEEYLLVTHHLTGCEECKRECDELTLLSREVKALGAASESPSGDPVKRVLTEIKRESRSRRSGAKDRGGKWRFWARWTLIPVPLLAMVVFLVFSSLPFVGVGVLDKAPGNRFKLLDNEMVRGTRTKSLDVVAQFLWLKLKSHPQTDPGKIYVCLLQGNGITYAQYTGLLPEQTFGLKFPASNLPSGDYELVIEDLNIKYPFNINNPQEKK